MMTEPTPHSVLIVDDEVAIRSILDRLFRGAGYRVECAATGVEGLKRFYQTSPEVVIVDRGMPEMNGEDMAQQIKSTHPHIPIIMITGLPHLVTRHSQYLAILSKPFRPSELMDLVARELPVRCGE
jgi:CheY-like chemotaxis protein